MWPKRKQNLYENLKVNQPWQPGISPQSVVDNEYFSSISWQPMNWYFTASEEVQLRKVFQSAALMKHSPIVSLSFTPTPLSKIFPQCCSAGNYAFLCESSMLDWLVQRDCNLTQVGGLVDNKGYGIATPKGSRWKDKISKAILLLQEKSAIQVRIIYVCWQGQTPEQKSWPLMMVIDCIPH